MPELMLAGVPSSVLDAFDRRGDTLIGSTADVRVFVSNSRFGNGLMVGRGDMAWRGTAGDMSVMEMMSSPPC